jgi:hypothetical protein
LIRWDYVLGILGVLLAIPSLLAPWFSGPPALALAGAIAGIACVGAAVFVQRFLNLPAISIESQTTSITFGNDRTVARMVKRYEFRVHRKGLDHWVHRNISSEGEISDFRWNGRPLPASDVLKRSGSIQVTVRNPYVWPLRKNIHGELSYVLTDSFPGPVEYLQYVSDMPTKLAVLRVQFPPGQHCTDVYVQERRNGVVETLDNGVRRSPDGHWLEFEVRKPKGGYEYTVYWHW